MLRRYDQLNLEAVKTGSDFDSFKSWNEAAKAGGFKDKIEFDRAVGQWAETGNVDELARISKKLADEHTRAIELIMREQTEGKSGKEK